MLVVASQLGLFCGNNFILGHQVLCVDKIIVACSLNCNYAKVNTCKCSLKVGVSKRSPKALEASLFVHTGKLIDWPLQRQPEFWALMS